MGYWRAYLVAVFIAFIILESCSVCEPLVSPPGSFRVDMFVSGDEGQEPSDTSFYLIYGITEDSFTFEAPFFVFDPATGDVDTIIRVVDTTGFFPELDMLYNIEDSALSTIELPAKFTSGRTGFNSGFVFVEGREGDVAVDSFSTEGLLSDAIAGRKKDTLFFDYVRDLVVIGPDCGFFEQIVDIQLTVNTFDEAILRSTKIETDSVNVEIRF